ncbi:MAG: hypothetical protein IPN30_06465 [Flavobacteriales bacterium]|nr:hypothetical protein [Flavobacteriales bacterium]
MHTRAPIRYPLELDPNAALRDAIGYLMRAQEVGGTGGLGSYHLIKGWSAPYPETTDTPFLHRRPVSI